MSDQYSDKKDFKNTPFFQDEIDCETEQRYRIKGVYFILNTPKLIVSA